MGLLPVLLFISACGPGGADARGIPLDQRIERARAELTRWDASRAHRPVESAAAVERLFELLYQAGQLDTDEAQTLAERDLVAHGDAEHDPIGHALALDRRARVALAQADFAAAERVAQQAASLLQRSSPDDDASASVEVTLGRVLTAQGKRSEANALLERAVAALDARGIVDMRLHAALQMLLYNYSGSKITQAQAAFTRALDVAKTLEGADGPLAADDRVLESFVPRLHGDLAASMTLLEQALPVLRDARPRPRGAYARAMLAYAQLQHVSGDDARAESIYREAIALEEAQASERGYRLAALDADLAIVLATHGRHAEAAGVEERALALFRHLLGPDARRTLVVEEQLARDYVPLARLDEAAVLLRHVLDVNERDPNTRDPYTLRAPFDLGEIMIWQGRYADAEHWYRLGFEHAGKHAMLDGDYPRSDTAGLAVSLWAQGRDDEAFDQAQRAAQQSLGMVRTAGADLDEHHTISFHSSLAGTDFDWMLAIAAHSGKPQQARAAWTYALEWRGLATAMTAQRLANARRANDPDLEDAWKEWRRRNEALVQARIEVANAASPDAIARLDDAERTFELADRALAQYGSTTGRVAHADLTALLAALPRDAVLVDFEESEASEPGDLGHPRDRQHGRLYAFIAARSTPPRVLDLGATAPLRNDVEAWLALVRDRHADAHARDAAGMRVRERVWDAIAREWPQKRVLMVLSPDLQRLPFAALPTGDGRYLVETGYAFHILDHERDLLPARTPSRNASLVLVGAPDFSSDAATASDAARGMCGGLRGAVFAPLPHAAREIEALHDLWLQRHTGIAPTVLTGTDATEARARAALPGSRIVHFATHGLYLGDRCEPAVADARSVKT
ncbi:MAG TPA: CHAT domain-containing protein, partial [Rudaea sp.]|nr:CHAT domain-containing protein [Rudaea sp.]